MNYAILFDKDNKEIPVKSEQEYKEKLLNGHTIKPTELKTKKNIKEQK